MSEKKESPSGAQVEKRNNLPIIAAIIGAVATITAALITAIAAPIVLYLVGNANASAATPTASAQQPSPMDPADVLGVRISLPITQCPNVAFPPEIDPAQDPTLAAQQASQAKTLGETDQWPIVGGEDLVLDLTVTSLLKDAAWIQTDNAVDVIVSADPAVPDHTQALALAWGCGGGGLKRTFSDIGLSTDYETYTVESESSEFDFFTLQPGEFEVFSLPFQCKGPGIYHLTFELPYTLAESTGTASYRLDRTVICPKAYTSWALEEGNFLFFTEFLWDGQQYQQKT